MHGLQMESMQCPYCGEQIDVTVDCSVDDQEYIEDCSVCCRPILFSVQAIDGEVISIEGRAEND
ncbi:MAG: CPXCG motif-containing cysteine-rich protein [Methylococcales bacterium]|nr:CPXCG motif-containing cysteine-rich protein [Methylococcales bacterium]